MGAIELFVFAQERGSQTGIINSDDYLELLLYRALVETNMVSLSLKSGKVYVGIILSSFDPANERKYVAVLPVKSGYRREGLTLQFTTD